MAKNPTTVSTYKFWRLATILLTAGLGLMLYSPFAIEAMHLPHWLFIVTTLIGLAMIAYASKDGIGWP